MLKENRLRWEMGIDHESIKLHLKELRDCVDKLKPISKLTKDDFTNDPVLPDLAERSLQVAIQICLDIGNHIISTCGMPLPTDYNDIFVTLGKEGTSRVSPLPERGRLVMPVILP